MVALQTMRSIRRSSDEFALRRRDALVGAHLALDVAGRA